MSLLLPEPRSNVEMMNQVSVYKEEFCGADILFKFGLVGVGHT
jgi:hypothetical protein